tara:strand:+ start:10713 stop:10925 length:213 start_codon:yes stop_codon:yes gene_type:complete
MPYILFAKTKKIYPKQLPVKKPKTAPKTLFANPRFKDFIKASKRIKRILKKRYSRTYIRMLEIISAPEPE